MDLSDSLGYTAPTSFSNVLGYFLVGSAFFTMPYLYFGKTSLYKGRPLFKLLCKLRDHGRGRIVYRTIDHYDRPGEISFFRILLAQPLMDQDTLHGRVVAERVYRGLRQPEPVVLSSVAHKPDFRLVPKDEEEEFCQWDKVRDYEKGRDAPSKPASIEMPPLMREYIKRSRRSRGESVEDKDFHLPGAKIYSGEFNLEDRVQSDDMAQYLEGRFASHKDFDMGLVPKDWWLRERQVLNVGRPLSARYNVGKKNQNVQKERDEEYERLVLKQQELTLSESEVK